MKKVIIIFVIFFIVLTVISCSTIPKNKTEANINKYSEDIGKYQSAISIGEMEAFKNELEGYLSYSKILFSIRDDFINTTEPILNKFNIENNFDQKISNAAELKAYNQSFLDKIRTINPPDIAKKAHLLALSTTKQRIE